MNELFEIGFEQAGHWKLVDGKLNYKLDRFREARNVLYAFVCDGEVMYVGKTTKKLATRISGYVTPDPSQRTNHRLNRLLVQSLQNDLAIQILAWPDSGLMHLGKFHVNLAAGLEDSVISRLKPAWNVFKSKRELAESVARCDRSK